jgi:hypothetical protein
MSCGELPLLHGQLEPQFAFFLSTEYSATCDLFSIFNEDGFALSYVDRIWWSCCSRHSRSRATNASWIRLWAQPCRVIGSVQSTIIIGWEKDPLKNTVVVV